MADFMTNLWSAVFEAGPTPTLLIATNASFGALQVVLFALLLLTHSIHFVILSVLCAGLWLAINWFAAELKAVRAAELQRDMDIKANSPTDAAGVSAHAADVSLHSEADVIRRKAHLDNGIDSEWEKIDSQ